MRPYLIFAAAGLSLFMISMDGTAVAVALPNIIRDFDTTVVWAGWTLSIYMIAVTSVMPLVGRLSDTFGRRPLYLASLLLFTLSSLACGLARKIATPASSSWGTPSSWSRAPSASRPGPRRCWPPRSCCSASAWGSPHRPRTMPALN